MTRKRFIKKMMGLGYSRNEANALAARARRYGVSYAARWEREKINAAGRDSAAGLRAGLSALGRSVDRFATELRKCAEAAAKVCAALGATSFYKLDPAGYEPEPADMWPKGNPHLRITDVSLVASGGVPLNYGQNCDGLRTLADELAGLFPPEYLASGATEEQIENYMKHIMTGSIIVAHVPGQGLVAHSNAAEGGPISWTVAGGDDNAD